MSFIPPPFGVMVFGIKNTFNRTETEAILSAGFISRSLEVRVTVLKSVCSFPSAIGAALTFSVMSVEPAIGNWVIFQVISWPLT